MAKNIEFATNQVGLKCDNTTCDYTDPSVTIEQLAFHINRKCPKCGESLLTPEDYARTQTVIATADFINTLSEEQIKQLGRIYTEETIEGLETPDPNTRYSMRVETHNEIKVTDIKPLS